MEVISHLACLHWVAGGAEGYLSHTEFVALWIPVVISYTVFDLFFIWHAQRREYMLF